jgi:pyruvate formate lyase activating enzyme
MIKSELCSGCGICEKVCPTGAIRIIGRKVEVREVLDQIIRDVTFYRMSGGGITLSGGEPLFQADFALAIVKSCRELGIHTVLDTSGISEWNNLKMIAENVNIVFLDIKLMDKKKHEIYTGLSAEVVQKNALRLSEAGIPIVVRVPIIPEINDDCDNIVRLGEFVRELKSMERIDLLPYHRLGTEKYVKLGRSYQLEHIPVPSSEQMYKIATLLRKFVENVKVVY